MIAGSTVNGSRRSGSRLTCATRYALPSDAAGLAAFVAPFAVPVVTAALLSPGNRRAKFGGNLVEVGLHGPKLNAAVEREREVEASAVPSAEIIEHRTDLSPSGAKVGERASHPRSEAASHSLRPSVETSFADSLGSISARTLFHE